MAGLERAWTDPRLTGFADRATLAEARDWLDGCAPALGAERVAAGQAAGRVLAEAVALPAQALSAARAGIDGYAVRAADTLGAGDYNPLLLRLLDRPALPAGAAALVASGTRLPEGADAVLPFELAQPSGPGGIEALGPVAQGAGLERRIGQDRAGAVLLRPGMLLGAAQAGLLALLGITEIRAVRRPRVALVIPGPKDDAADALGPMLRALLERDGGEAAFLPPPAPGRDALARSIRQAAELADSVIVAGRSGAGPDDAAAPALRDAGGALGLHGIALRPGSSAGLGRLGGAPVLLLPGTPAACLACYEMLAGRLVRRLGGRPVSLPFPSVPVRLGRKIVSALGFADLVPVKLADGSATPLGAAEDCGLEAAARADGFVLVPEGREGHAEGEQVVAWLRDPGAASDAGLSAHA